MFLKFSSFRQRNRIAGTFRKSVIIEYQKATKTF
jgi:hypothetical protein